MTKYVPKHLSSRAGYLDAARMGAAAARSSRSAVALGVSAALPAGAAALLTAPAFAAEEGQAAQAAQGDSPKALAFDARGAEVKELQARLALVRDGWYGPVTTAAVKDFQRANGLDVDGIVGSKTWAALNATSTKPDSSAGSDDSVLGEGDEGALVRAVQTKLGVAADGVFGPKTLAAVKAFQEERGLATDGVVGVQTTYALAKASEAKASDAADKNSKDSKDGAKKDDSQKTSRSTVRSTIVDANAPYEMPFQSGYVARISQGPYGAASHYKTNDKHHVDFAVPVGTPVVASRSGVVIMAQGNGSGGNVVLIRDASGYAMEYAHLSTMNVVPGQRVEQGQQIALSGNTGNSTGPHLHWGIVDGRNFVSIKIAESKELGTSYAPGTLVMSHNG